MNRQKLTSGLLALVVLVSGLTLAIGPAVAFEDTTVDEDDIALVVEVDWDDLEAVEGELERIDVEGDSGMYFLDHDVTVRDVDGTSTTYWVTFEDLDPNNEIASGDMLEVSLSDGMMGSVTHADSTSIDGSSVVQIADGEGVTSNLTVDGEYPDGPMEIDISAISEDGSTTLNTTTATVNADGSAHYVDLDPINLESTSSNVTVQIDGSVNDFAVTDYSPITDYNAALIDEGGTGGTGDGDGLEGDTTIYVIGGMAALVALLLIRD